MAVQRSLNRPALPCKSKPTKAVRVGIKIIVPKSFPLGGFPDLSSSPPCCNFAIWMKGIDAVLIQVICEECVYTEEPHLWNGAVLSLKGSCAAQKLLRKCVPCVVHFLVPSFCEGAPRTHRESGNSAVPS